MNKKYLGRMLVAFLFALVLMLQITVSAAEDPVAAGAVNRNVWTQGFWATKITVYDVNNIELVKTDIPFLSGEWIGISNYFTPDSSDTWKYSDFLSFPFEEVGKIELDFNVAPTITTITPRQWLNSVELLGTSRFSSRWIDSYTIRYTIPVDDTVLNKSNRFIFGVSGKGSSGAAGTSTSFAAGVELTFGVPDTIYYEQQHHVIGGLTTDMEYRYYGDNLSEWIPYTGTTGRLNLYPLLSASRGTTFEIRFIDQGATMYPATFRQVMTPLATAPKGLSIEWSSDNKPILQGLKSNYYYNYSLTSNFSSYWKYQNTNYSGVYVTSTGITPGDILYVRCSANPTTTSPCYATNYAEVIVPPYPNAPKSAMEETNTLEQETVELIDDSYLELEELGEREMVDLNLLQE